MEPKKPTYRDINGTTRIGDFLRKIGRSDLLKSVVDFAAASGVPFLSVVGDFITHNEKIDLQNKALAQRLLEQDLKEAENITGRWKNDMLSDSFLSKNVRPMVLIYSWVLITMLFFRLDVVSDISKEYLDLVKTLTVAVNVAYFGGREWVKYLQVKNTKL